LANTAQTIQYLGDVSDASVFNGGATGLRKAQQEYAVAYVQDEWHVSRAATINIGLRYDYYTPLREARNLDVLFDVTTGKLKDPSTPFFTVSKTNLQPRASLTFAPGRGKAIYRVGGGMFV